MGFKQGPQYPGETRSSLTMTVNLGAPRREGSLGPPHALQKKKKKKKKKKTKKKKRE